MVSTIENTIIDAEEIADVDIDSVILGINGLDIESFFSRGTIAITDVRQEIRPLDKERVLEAAQTISLPSNRKLIHVIPVEYSVDEQTGIRDPLGMMGTRLEVNTHIVTHATTALQNMIKAVNSAGLSIKSVILQSIAAAEVALTPDERELGVVLIDIGGDTTGMAIYHQGMLQHTAIIPMGSDHVSNDIAVCLVLPTGEADRAKIEYGSVLFENIDDDQTVELKGTKPGSSKKISRRDLCEIIASRMEEIFELVRTELNNSSLQSMTPSGFVITGGGSLLDGLIPFVNKLLNKPVRLGQPHDVHDLTDKISTPHFSTAVGLLMRDLKDSERRYGNFGESTSTFRKLLNWFRDWLRDLF
jgi:cell division protein FtsA